MLKNWKSVAVKSLLKTNKHLEEGIHRAFAFKLASWSFAVTAQSLFTGAYSAALLCKATVYKWLGFNEHIRDRPLL